MKVSHQKILAQKYLLIDGISRTGKMMLSKIIPSLKKFEQVEYVEFIEYILAALHLKKVSFDFANSYIIQTLNEMSYNKLIARKQNFRPGDVTNSRNFQGKKMYENRFKNPEGSTAIKKILKSKNYFPLMSHDVMVHYNHFKKFKFNYKIIQIYRNPFDTIYSWYKRGWGHRFQSDLQPAGLLISYNKKLYPWYVVGKEKAWQRKNSLEKCTDIVLDIIEQSIRNHRKVKRNKNILTLSYEDFIQNTHKNLANICKFLNTKKTRRTKKILKRENCPKKYDYKKYLEKKLYIKSQVSSKIYLKICRYEKRYQNNIYNLRK